MAKPAVAFPAWMAAVNAAVIEKCGLCAADLPDWPYMPAWERGVSPKSAAAKAVKAAKES